MDVTTPVVQEFFDQYVRSRSAMDIDRIASQYADSSMFAGPDGVWVAEKQAILAGFPKALELLKTVGHTSTRLAALHETRVDDLTQWCVLSSYGVLRRPRHHRSMSRSIPRSSCISRTAFPRLSFNMSTRISGRRCERAACCRRRDDSVERAPNTCTRSCGSYFAPNASAA